MATIAKPSNWQPPDLVQIKQWVAERYPPAVMADIIEAAKLNDEGKKQEIRSAVIEAADFYYAVRGRETDADEAPPTPAQQVAGLERLSASLADALSALGDLDARTFAALADAAIMDHRPSGRLSVGQIHLGEARTSLSRLHRWCEMAAAVIGEERTSRGPKGKPDVRVAVKVLAEAWAEAHGRPTRRVNTQNVEYGDFRVFASAAMKPLTGEDVSDDMARNVLNSFVD